MFGLGEHLFRDRHDAGCQLAAALKEYRDIPSGVVIGLPRGGVPVAAEVARVLRLPLDVLLVRKLGSPGREELAMGAIAQGGVTILNEDVIAGLGVTLEQIEAEIDRQRKVLEAREMRYRGAHSFPELAQKTIFLIDDGMATGATTQAAVSLLRHHDPAAIVLAVPVASRASVQRLSGVADRVVALHIPEPFMAVAQWYVSMPQTEDGEVESILRGAWGER